MNLHFIYSLIGTWEDMKATVSRFGFTVIATKWNLLLIIKNLDVKRCLRMGICLGMQYIIQEQ